jgi:hypothetical protein
MKREAPQGMLRLILCATCLLLTCWLAQASEPERTSPEPSTGLSPLAELASQIGPGPYSRDQVVALLLAADEEIKATAEQAAAEAVKPLLVELAGSRAETAAARRAIRPWRWAAIIGVPAAALIGSLIGCAFFRY